MSHYWLWKYDTYTYISHINHKFIISLLILKKKMLLITHDLNLINFIFNSINLLTLQSAGHTQYYTIYEISKKIMTDTLLCTITSSQIIIFFYISYFSNKNDVVLVSLICSCMDTMCNSFLVVNAKHIRYFKICWFVPFS